MGRNREKRGRGSGALQPIKNWRDSMTFGDKGWRPTRRRGDRLETIHTAHPAATFPYWDFPTLDFEYDAPSRSAWMVFKAEGAPCFTLQTLIDIADLGQALRRLYATDVIKAYPIDYIVLASNKPGVFNLGGDLSLFAQAIRDGHREALRGYAYACIDVVHAAAVAYDLPVVTVAVVNGQALGGGLEAALAHDVLFGEQSAMLGVPEVAFNTFPGMGAITMLTRRIGAARTEQIVMSGRSYPARRMLEMGVIDRLAPDGGGRAAALAWMQEGGAAALARRRAVMQARRRCFPVAKQELLRIVDVWTDCSCDVTPRDLRHMDRLVAAQRKLTMAA